jgi:hypothetical protein
MDQQPPTGCRLRQIQTLLSPSPIAYSPIQAAAQPTDERFLSGCAKKNSCAPADGKNLCAQVSGFPDVAIAA